MVECISKVIIELRKHHEVINLKAMNAHKENLDGYTDSTGNMLREMCERHNLHLRHTGEKCDGRITWETGSLHCTTAYALMSNKMYGRQETMKIDGGGSRSLGSDYKRIKLSFTRKGNTGTEHDKQLDQTFYTKKQSEIVVKQIEEIISWDTQTDLNYTELTKLFE